MLLYSDLSFAIANAIVSLLLLLLWARVRRNMENEMSKNAVQLPQDTHFLEEAPQNGKVASRARDACSVKRFQVCNSEREDDTVQWLVERFYLFLRLWVSPGRLFWSPLPARAPPIIVRTLVMGTQTPSNQ